MTEEEKKDVEKQMKELKEKIEKETNEKIKTITSTYENQMKEEVKKALDESEKKHNEQIAAIIAGRDKTFLKKQQEDKKDEKCFFETALKETFHKFGIDAKRKEN